MVERTAWELADFRNDIYIPLCYDAAGTTTGEAPALQAPTTTPSTRAAAAMERERRTGMKILQ